MAIMHTSVRNKNDFLGFLKWVFQRKVQDAGLMW